MSVECDTDLENGQEKALEPVSMLPFLVEGTREFVMDVLVRDLFTRDLEAMGRFDTLVDPMIQKRSEENQGTNYEKIKERIRIALVQAEKHTGKKLSDFEVQFLTHFWEQHLRRNGEFRTILKYADPEKILYPAMSEYTGIAQKTIHHFVANYNEVKANFAQVAPQIQEILKSTSLVMLMNHDALTTQIISCLSTHEGLDDFPVERNGIVMGPMLLTASQWGILDLEKAARSVSDGYCTIPDTQNGRPDDLNPRRLQLLAGHSGVKIKNDMKGTNPTKIFHISPSATTDTKNADGTITMKNVGDGTAHFLTEALNKLKIPVCLVGMNHNGMYTNGTPRVRPVHVHFGPIIYPGDLTGFPREITDQIMERLAQNVQDSEGRQIGRYERQ